MKYALLFVLLAAALLSSCGSSTPETDPAVTETFLPAETVIPETTTTIPETTIPETTVPETTIPETAVPETTQPPETAPEHSSLYIPGITADEVFRYFQEVCLAAEFVNSGDPSVLQKWYSPIGIQILGSPTEEDLLTLRTFMEKLNAMEGFPGFFETSDPVNTSLKFYFCDQAEMISHLGENFWSMDGGVTFWYLENRIYEGIICCRTDIDQHIRNSVILEELYNGLGPIQDTALRSDSIIWQEYSTPQDLTELDWLILKLLYHPDMQCGMDSAQCEAVIRRLYY